MKQANSTVNQAFQMQPNEMDWILKPELNPKSKTMKGGLAISNIRYCQNKQQIYKENFVAVLSICGDKSDIPVEVQHLWICVNDSPSEQISVFFQSTFQFIEKHIKSGNVLVHCQAGISRSTSIVIAYLIKKNNMSFQKAYQIVKIQRPITQPNKGFAKQLRRFAKQMQTKKKGFTWPFGFCLS